VQNFYELLSVGPRATPDEIKRAFRSEIARYHPDKVQHLGKEFQEMAASRAAALTEAYRTLMNAELRAEYDRAHGAPAGAPAPAAPAAPPDAPVQPAQARVPHPDPGRPAGDRHVTPPPRFASERRDRDDFVRKAILNRFRQALAAEPGQAEDLPVRGFDAGFALKSKKLFSRDGGHRFAVKVVPQVDRRAVQDAWNAAQKTNSPICVFLMGSGVAPVGELAEAIGELRKRTRNAQISVIPVDVRDWSAHVPADAPEACRNLLKRLRDVSVA
jgi:curved DNA-binding protein CbpA